MKNSEIRIAIQQSHYKHYEIAEQIGIDESTLSRWMHVRLSDERKEKILTAIDELQKGNEVEQIQEEKPKKRGKKNV